MKKRILMLLMAVCLFVLPQSGMKVGAKESVWIEESEIPVTGAGYGYSGDLNQPKLSKAEILQLLEDNPLTVPATMFDVMPNCAAPYATGKVNDTAIGMAVNRLNALRRLAGLPAVSVDSELNTQAQYGAVLLATRGVSFSHYPAQPADMEDAFYQEAKTATSSSNLYAGRSLSAAMDGFMVDSDASNVSRLGHRRWQLNPTLGRIGLGYAENSDSAYRRYVVEKVFDRSGQGCEYDFIAWPASGNFPTAQFGRNTAWSVTLNPEKYQTPVKQNVSVVLKRESDGAVWNFSGSNTYESSGSGEYFNVDNGGYGVSNCIIFRPGSIADGSGSEIYDGVYTVTISGLKDIQGNAAELSYYVDFFTTADESEMILTEEMFIVDTSDEVYDGTAKTKNIISTLAENTDYTVSYANNTNAGTATIYINGMGNYSGQLVKNFKIQKAVRQLEIAVTRPFLYLYNDNENKVSVIYDNAAGENPVYQYTSLNSESAEVNDYGWLVPVGEGNATILLKAEETANYASAMKTAVVTVKYPTVTIGDTLNGKIVLYESQSYVRQQLFFRAVSEAGYQLKRLTVLDGSGNELSLWDEGNGYYNVVVPASDISIWAVFEMVIPEHDCSITRFTDIDSSSWYHFALDYVVDEGMMAGTSEYTFEPDACLTRAMLAQILYNKEGTPEADRDVVFEDVPVDAWYADAVSWLVSEELASGYPEGGFGAEDFITREQVAVILKNYGEYKGYEVSAGGELSQFTDGADVNEWAKTAMEWAIGAGIMSGKSSTLLDPGATATRAEIAQMLKNFNEAMTD